MHIFLGECRRGPKNFWQRPGARKYLKKAWCLTHLFDGEHDKYRK